MSWISSGSEFQHELHPEGNSRSYLLKNLSKPKGYGVCTYLHHNQETKRTREEKKRKNNSYFWFEGGRLTDLAFRTSSAQVSASTTGRPSSLISYSTSPSSKSCLLSPSVFPSPLSSVYFDAETKPHIGQNSHSASPGREVSIPQLTPDFNSNSLV